MSERKMVMYGYLSVYSGSNTIDFSSVSSNSIVIKRLWCNYQPVMYKVHE